VSLHSETFDHLVTSPASPQVSVLIPTYQYARYLPQAIESVLSQSFADFELIISDDNSSDGSADVVQSYAARDRRIRFTSQSPNLGMVANWNWCLEQARGTYIKYVFGDDFLMSSDAIARFVEMMQQPRVRLAASARTVVDEESRPIELWNNIQHNGVFEGEHVISWSLRANCNLVGEPSVVMFRKADAARGFDPSYKQIVDWEFWIHLLQQGNLAYSNESLCAFRRHDLQQSAVNCRSDGAASEHPRLLVQYSQYATQRAEHQQELFDRLYRLERSEGTEEADPDMAAAVRAALGKRYYACLVRHRAHRLSLKARRFWLKYVRDALPLDARPPRSPLFIHAAKDIQPSYVYINPTPPPNESSSTAAASKNSLVEGVRILAEVSPGYSYSREAPTRIFAKPEFERALSEHYRHIDQTYRSGAASHLVELTDVTVAHNVLYLNRGNSRHVVYETHRPPERNDSPLLVADAQVNTYPSDPNAVYLYIGSMGSNTYGHWLVDDLPRLAAFDALRKTYPDQIIDIVLSSQGRLDQCMRWNSARMAAIRAYLKGAENYRVRFINVMRPFAFRRLHFVTPVSYHPVLKSPESLAMLAESLVPPSSDTRPSGQKIFVVRRTQSGRILQNMHELARRLGTMGFEIVDPESMSIAAQAVVFARARVVVGIMGSAMTNTLFCGRGTKVLHVAPEGWLEPFYWDLAAARNHVYAACYGPTSSTPGPVHMTSFTITPDDVVRTLREVGD